KDAVGTLHPSLEPVDSSTPRSAPLSRCTLLRHSSFVRAVCVDALVRICAGGRSVMVVPTATVSGELRSDGPLVRAGGLARSTVAGKRHDLELGPTLRRTSALVTEWSQNWGHFVELSC